MKKLVVDYFMNIIVKDNKYAEIKLQEIRYGLEGLYLNISKLIIFLIINIIIGNLGASLLFILFFIPIKSFSYGFHAKTSLQCWLISAFCFVGLPFLTNYIEFNFLFKMILIVCFFIIFTFFSPADTPRKPILSSSIRLRLRVSSLFVVSIYSFIILNFPSLATVLILVLLLQSIMISPLIYSIFKVQYNNYLYYKKGCA